MKVYSLISGECYYGVIDFEETEERYKLFYDNEIYKNKKHIMLPKENNILIKLTDEEEYEVDVNGRIREVLTVKAAKINAAIISEISKYIAVEKKNIVSVKISLHSNLLFTIDFMNQDGEEKTFSLYAFASKPILEKILEPAIDQLGKSFKEFITYLKYKNFHKKIMDSEIVHNYVNVKILREEISAEVLINKLLTSKNGKFNFLVFSNSFTSTKKFNNPESKTIYLSIADVLMINDKLNLKVPDTELVDVDFYMTCYDIKDNFVYHLKHEKYYFSAKISVNMFMPIHKLFSRKDVILFDIYEGITICATEEFILENLIILENGSRISFKNIESEYIIAKTYSRLFLKEVKKFLGKEKFNILMLRNELELK